MLRVISEAWNKFHLGFRDVSTALSKCFNELFEKLIVNSLFKVHYHAGHYREPDESNPNLPTQFHRT